MDGVSWGSSTGGGGGEDGVLNLPEPCVPSDHRQLEFSMALPNEPRITLRRAFRNRKGSMGILPMDRQSGHPIPLPQSPVAKQWLGLSAFSPPERFKELTSVGNKFQIKTT